MDYYDQVRPEKRATNRIVITSLDYGLHQNTMSIYVWTLKEQVAFQNFSYFCKKCNCHV